MREPELWSGRFLIFASLATTGLRWSLCSNRVAGESGMNTSRQSPIAAAVICGFAIYVPVPGLRGGLFGLFPGYAQRSVGTALKGFALGLFVDLTISIAWIFFGPTWEPRASYNSVLAHYLPPEHMIMTHHGSPLPNYVQFTLGLALWTSAQFSIWIRLWKPKIQIQRQRRIYTSGVVSVVAAATILWIVSPMDGWWHHGAAPFGDLPPIPLAGVFLLSMPCCTVAVAYAIQSAVRGDSTSHTFNEETA